MKEELISNFDSLSEKDISQYAEEWIAIIDGKVVAHNKQFQEMNEYIKKNYPGKRPLITKLPAAMPVVLSIG